MIAKDRCTNNVGNCRIRDPALTSRPARRARRKCTETRTYLSSACRAHTAEAVALRTIAEGECARSRRPRAGPGRLAHEEPGTHHVATPRSSAKRADSTGGCRGPEPGATTPACCTYRGTTASRRLLSPGGGRLKVQGRLVEGAGAPSRAQPGWSLARASGRRHRLCCLPSLRSAAKSATRGEGVRTRGGGT